MSDTELHGTAQTIYEEALDEIDEEFRDSFADLLQEDPLASLIANVHRKVKRDLRETIQEDFQEGMSEVNKMMLGEKLSWIISQAAKEELQALLAQVTGKSLNLIDELRTEVIGEVFEETEE